MSVGNFLQSWCAAGKSPTSCFESKALDTIWQSKAVPKSYNFTLKVRLLHAMADIFSGALGIRSHGQ